MSKWLETNMQIIRNNLDETITITAKKITNFQITNLMAFTNRGNEIHLTLPETHRAESLLLREGNKL